MAVAGYRTTEASDVRILENGDVRVTENFYTADVALSASAGFDFVGNLKATGQAAFQGETSLVVNGNIIRYAAIMVANQSSISATGVRTTVGEISFAATGTIAALPSFIFKGSSNLTATGGIAPTARTVKYVSVEAGQVEFLRILENDDYRVTEDGNNRITNDVATNEIVSSMVVSGLLIPFTSEAYIRQNGVWKLADIDAKNNGNWNALQAVYKKISGNWKRIY